MKKILVTGAGGLVGYDVMNALINDSKYQVWGTVHNQEIKDWQNTIKIDLKNTDLESLKLEFDYIIHCAARIPTDIYKDEQVALINRCIDDNIIDYCSKHKCRLIYISSASVYGYEDHVLLTENTKLSINSKYQAEKRNSEIRIEKKCNSYCVLRVSSPYGFRQETVTVLKRFINAVCVGEDIFYFGSGERTQNFIDVRDIAQAVLMCIECEENGIFNIADAKSISMKQLANLVVKVGNSIFGTTSKVCAGNNIDNQENVRVNIDISLAKKIIGWRPQIELEEGIKYWMQSLKEGV